VTVLSGRCSSRWLPVRWWMNDRFRVQPAGARVWPVGRSVGHTTDEPSPDGTCCHAAWCSVVEWCLVAELVGGMGVDLHSAAREGDVAAVADLVDDGADLDARDHNGMTALMQAMWRGHAAVATLLIERGSDLAITDLGGSNARDWAEVVPEVIPLLDQRHAVRNRVDAIEHPYDEDGLDPRTTAFLARLRDGGYLAAADPDVLAHLRPDMPAAMKALLHTWAHKPASNWMRVGVWRVERRSLHTGLPAGVPLPDGVEPERTICVGVNELGEWLMITWAPDGSTPVWSFHLPTRRLRPIAASLEQFLASTRPST